MRLASLLVCALICAGCVRERGPGPEDQKTKLLPFGSVDSPHAGQSVAGALLVGGWAIHESGIQSVEIFFDRKYAADARVGLDRPDVGGIHRAYQHSRDSGWNGLIDTTQLLPGPHELIVKVYAKNGATRDFSLPVVVANPK